MINESDPYLLFYDGSCGMCRRMAGFARWTTRGGYSWSMRPSAADGVFSRFAAAPAMQSVHLLAPWGEMHRGYDVIVVLVSLLPGMRWLSVLMGMVVARKIGWAVYEWVTVHRHEISRLFARVKGVDSFGFLISVKGRDAGRDAFRRECFWRAKLFGHVKKRPL